MIKIRRCVGKEGMFSKRSITKDYEVLYVFCTKYVIEKTFKYIKRKSL